MKISYYKIFLLLIFLAFWIWSALSPLDKETWLIENALVFIFVPLIIIFGIYFRLSNISYTFITSYLILHAIGSHYTYSQVPFGFFLGELLNSSKNLYDSLVHFLFGLLFFYPFREIIVKKYKIKILSYALPILIIFSLAALYEIAEWIAVDYFASQEAGAAFLGAQGDAWDAQKDMLLALIGGAIAMFLSFIALLRTKKSLL